MPRLDSQNKFGQRTKKYRNLNSRGSSGVNSGRIRKAVSWSVIAASGFFMAILLSPTFEAGRLYIHGF